jgi:hypothetical protein
MVALGIIVLGSVFLGLVQIPLKPLQPNVRECRVYFNFSCVHVLSSRLSFSFRGPNCFTALALESCRDLATPQMKSVFFYLGRKSNLASRKSWLSSCLSWQEFCFVASKLAHMYRITEKLRGGDDGVWWGGGGRD